MSSIVVTGGSIGGLAAALFAARAGHDVVLVEADGRTVPASVDEVWHDWKRRGVPQFRQLHGTQALGRAILASRASDVLDRLRAAGAHDADLLASRPDARQLPGAGELVQFRCRRPVFEWVLRAAVAAEPRVRLRAGVEVTGLRVAAACKPRVTGVATTVGELTADLLVDATGRRSRVAEWCVRSGSAPPTTRTVDARQVYFTQWFRRDTAFTGSDPMLRVELAFATLLVLPVDAGWFSATFFAPAHDRGLRAVLHSTDGFLGALRSVPAAAPWIEDARPCGTVQCMGKLANQLRRPSLRSPAGLLPVADAAVCTNPTWGRGAALALAHAAALADLLDAEEEPSALTSALTAWTAKNLEPWFYDTVLLDAESNARWVGARPLPSPERPFLHTDVVRAARADPDLHVAYQRYRNLLDTPANFWRRPEIADSVRACAGDPRDGADLPGREELLARACTTA
jgi:2-polyprenyl-6-methoxyphenol hydroxylase-like FAD-dependent oxidoreductase